MAGDAHRQLFDLFATLEPMHLILKVFLRIGSMRLVVFIRRLIQGLSDLVANTGINEGMKALQCVSSRDAGETELPGKGSQSQRQSEQPPGNCGPEPAVLAGGHLLDCSGLPVEVNRPRRS